MKTSHGIPCNDYIHTTKARKNCIRYRFVTDDGNTPSSCTVQLGDIDPITGETITDMNFFWEYYKLVDHQIYENRKQYSNQVSIDAMTDANESRPKVDKIREYSNPAQDPFDTDLPDNLFALKTVAESLTGRYKEIYEALIISYAGGRVKLSMKDIADKYGVHLSQVYKDRKKIIRMIREAISDMKD